ncbi:peptidogalycan biosysnthesis protein [Prochlorococcus marinus]|uniref:peptidogalycan biosysnthesis protein n=1 Tax=Prochlorococcus marinus TaxID=1219 RepID=UPI0022B44192|nr:GNAT family N-acetyltransferase [Prochlorococcus marinus]
MTSHISACWHKSIKEIPKKALESVLTDEVIPFFKWNWLNCLEESKSVSNEYGWQPLHLSLWEDNKLIAFAPLYLKNHSFGEFIFDQSFGNLALKLGLEYYPKLIGMSPFSPVEGYKFFIANNKDHKLITEKILSLIDKFAIKNKILSCNFLYVDKKWAQYLEGHNYLKWINKQSLWTSHREKNFQEYLEKFNSNQRRNINKERKSIKNNGITVDSLNGKEIDLEMIGLMYNFYEQHCSKWGPWGSKYLTKEFFHQLLGNNIKEQIVLFNAHRNNPKNPIAMSLCITNKTKLWGRYWGSKENIKNLHFELCYYSPISWAIQNNIKNFDPGAGGTQKRRRGFLATPRLSLHRWYDTNMEKIIGEWLPKANYLMTEEINASNNEVPFKE